MEITIMDTVTEKKTINIKKDIFGDKNYMNSIACAREIMKIIFGDDLDIPSHMSFDMQRHGSYYKDGYFGFQMTASQPFDRQFLRSVRIKDGELDIEKVKEKFEEVRQVAHETKRHYDAMKEYEVNQEKERLSLREEILNEFGADKFDSYGEPFEHSYDREESLEDIDGKVGISNDMVTFTAKDLTAEEARKVYEFVKEMKS